MPDSHIERRPVILAHDEESGFLHSGEIAVESWIGRTGASRDLSDTRSQNSLGSKFLDRRSPSGPDRHRLSLDPLFPLMGSTGLPPDFADPTINFS
jgi:hypothetical protein